MTRFLSLLFAAMVLVQCGPEQTAREAEQQERDAITSEAKAQLTQFEGQYTGKIRIDAKATWKATLILRSFSELQPVTGSLEIVEIPNMVGFLWVGDDNLIIRNFSRGRYSKKEDSLQLLGAGSSVSPGGTSILTFMELHREGQKLVGTYISGKVIDLHVEFVRDGL